MRKVAAYAMESVSGDAAEASSAYMFASTTIDNWLLSKGEKGAGDGNNFIFKDGQPGKIIDFQEEVSGGCLRTIGLFEHVESGVFETRIILGHTSSGCAVFSELRAASVPGLLSPFQYDVRRPLFIKDLLGGEKDWYLGETLLPGRPMFFRGAQGAINLARLIWHADRSVPFVVISTEGGSSITDNFVDNVFSDLAGLAIVGAVDETASWALTDMRGGEWSCYNGAIRMYWPMVESTQAAKSHPLWTKASLFRGISEPRDASYRIRRQLRRQILGISAFSIHEPRLLRALGTELRILRRKELDENFKRGATANDYKEIAESYAKENDNLRDEIRSKEDRLNELEDQVENLQIALRYASSAQADLPPDDPGDVSELKDVLLHARSAHESQLLFADDIETGVQGLHSEAGPPAKVLRYLDVLAELAKARSEGLGVGLVPWLTGKGLSCSVESETVRNSDAERRKRSWRFNGELIEFNYHLKPSEHASPDRCVRIYFDLPEEHPNKVRVGWIGRHPE